MKLVFCFSFLLYIWAITDSFHFSNTLKTFITLQSIHYFGFENFSLVSFLVYLEKLIFQLPYKVLVILYFFLAFWTIRPFLFSDSTNTILLENKSSKFIEWVIRSFHYQVPLLFYSFESSEKLEIDNYIRKYLNSNQIWNG